MGLNAESNRPEEGLQLRLADKSVFFFIYLLEFFFFFFDNNDRMKDRKYQSESRLQGPNPEDRACRSQKPE